VAVASALREVEGYLRCGLLEHGCVRLACAGCGEELVVAFSCNAGVLAPNAKLRAEVVPGRRRDEELAVVDERRDGGAGVQGELFGGEPAANDEENADEARSSRHPWAWLLRRVFAVEVLVCVHCAGKLRIVEFATEPEATKRIARDERRRRGESVEHGSTLEARGPPRGPPGQLAFTFR
jgi:hypothetical protein